MENNKKEKIVEEEFTLSLKENKYLPEEGEIALCYLFFKPDEKSITKDEMNISFSLKTSEAIDQLMGDSEIDAVNIVLQGLKQMTKQLQSKFDELEKELS